MDHFRKPSFHRVKSRLLLFVTIYIPTGYKQSEELIPDVFSAGKEKGREEQREKITGGWCDFKGGKKRVAEKDLKKTSSNLILFDEIHVTSTVCVIVETIHFFSVAL